MHSAENRREFRGLAITKLTVLLVNKAQPTSLKQTQVKPINRKGEKGAVASRPGTTAESHPNRKGSYIR